VSTSVSYMLSASTLRLSAVPAHPDLEAFKSKVGVGSRNECADQHKACIAVL